MQKVFLIGNLTRDPELRQSNTSGTNYITFGLAVNTRAGGGQQEDTTFYNVRMFRQIETMQRYLTKGKKVAVTGDLSIRMYDGRDGQKRIDASVLVDSIEFLPSAPPPGQDGQQPYTPAPRPAQQQPADPPFGGMGAANNEGGFTQVEDDDLPF